MDEAPVRAGTIGETFKDLEDYVGEQPTSIISDTTPLLTAVDGWRADALAAPGRLRPLLDLNTIPSLAAVKHWQGQGAGFFVPIIVAWLVLGIAEWQYQSTDTEDSFFVWWSAQPMGPAAYSFVIAILLLGIVGFRVYRDLEARKADEVEATLSKFAATLCVQAARLMESDKPLASAASALTSAADRLSSVGASLSSMPTDVRDYLATAQTAGAAVARLEEVTSQLASQVESLTSSLGSTAGVVAQWDEKLAPVRETLDTLTSLSARSQARSAELSGQLETLARALPSAVDIAHTSGQTAQETSRSLPELVAAANAMASAAAALNSSQVRAQELINSAHRVVAFLDDRIDGKAVRHDWPSPTTTSGQAE